MNKISRLRALMQGFYLKKDESVYHKLLKSYI